MATILNLLGEAVEVRETPRRPGAAEPFRAERWERKYRTRDTPADAGCVRLTIAFFKWVHFDLEDGCMRTYRWLWSEEFARWAGILAPDSSVAAVRDRLIRTYWLKRPGEHRTRTGIYERNARNA